MERSDPAAWETRFDWTLTVLMLGAYALAIFFSGLSIDPGRGALWAALIAGTYIVALQVLPRRLRERQLIGEILAVTGVAATLAAVVLTDAQNGGYMLLVAVPIFFASAFMGFRVGMETALLAAVGLVAVLMALNEPVLDQAVTIALYLLIGFTFSQARRLLVIERSRSERLRAASQIDAARLVRLEEAHSLLVDLAEVTNTAELSAISIGETALAELANRLPIVGGQVVTQPDGEVVAELGHAGSLAEAVTVPVEASGRRLGAIRLWPEPNTEIDLDETRLVSTVAGVALAFDNIQLLQTVARRAVQDERSRVARELHDHIGPALASLGLTLDVLVHGRPDPAVTPQLRSLRAELTGLVERVRATVADLRRADTTTVMDHINSIALGRSADLPELLVTVDDRHLTDGAVAAEVAAILVEAVRNADRHAKASTVRIEGHVDDGHGRLMVTDDGAGFDPVAVYPGHFGLVGMRERAAAIGGELEIVSAAGAGSSVTVVWGDRTGETTST